MLEDFLVGGSDDLSIDLVGLGRVENERQLRRNVRAKEREQPVAVDGVDPHGSIGIAGLHTPISGRTSDTDNNDRVVTSQQRGLRAVDCPVPRDKGNNQLRQILHHQLDCPRFMVLADPRPTVLLPHLRCGYLYRLVIQALTGRRKPHTSCDLRVFDRILSGCILEEIELFLTERLATTHLRGHHHRKIGLHLDIGDRSGLAREKFVGSEPSRGYRTLRVEPRQPAEVSSSRRCRRLRVDRNRLSRQPSWVPRASHDHHRRERTAPSPFGRGSSV
ncbi:hypothetical protein ABH922_005148 [Rhodococcus sp. 27YEA15]